MRRGWVEKGTFLADEHPCWMLDVGCLEHSGIIERGQSIWVILRKDRQAMR